MPDLLCRNCSNRISEKSTYSFCLKCGTPITAPGPAPSAADGHCPNCGAPRASSARFCASCGTELSAAASPGSATVAVAAGTRTAPKRNGSSATGRWVGIIAALALLGYVLSVMGPGAAQQAAREAGLATTPAQLAGAQIARAPLPPTPEPPHIGSIVEAGNWRYSVRQVDMAQTVNRGMFGPKRAKGVYVLVWIELTNVGKENYIINLADFELRDDKDIKYTTDYDSDDVSKGRGQSAIGLGEKFPPGVKLTTTVVFDVAPGTSGMRLYLVQAKQFIRLE